MTKDQKVEIRHIINHLQSFRGSQIGTIDDEAWQSIQNIIDRLERLIEPK